MLQVIDIKQIFLSKQWVHTRLH